MNSNIHIYSQNFDKDEDEEDDFYEAANALPVRDRGSAFRG